MDSFKVYGTPGEGNSWSLKRRATDTHEALLVGVRRLESQTNDNWNIIKDFVAAFEGSEPLKEALHWSDLYVRAKRALNDR